ncbi:MAG: histidine phosphatase family protein [Actinobacteria bacterium]|nr:histidine phosphatase family protein [Actinomycetota bacterium]
MASHVVLVRHGQTEWTITGQHTGRSDIPLTDLGRQQALALKAMLDGYNFAEVFVSPFSRARETAELAGMGSVAVDEDLAEWDYGVYESRRTRDIRQEIPMWSVWSHEIIDGESVGQLGARCDRMIARTEEVDGQVALFGHGHALRVLGARWMGLPPTAGANLVLETASVSVLGWERQNRAIIHWNDCCHLRAEEHPY